MINKILIYPNIIEKFYIIGSLKKEIIKCIDESYRNTNFESSHANDANFINGT